MNAPSAFTDLIQIAYVTNDLDEARASFHEHYGVARFAQMKDLAIQVGPDANAIIHVALAYVGSMQIELIEPRGGADTIYRAPLPSDAFAMRFHHVAQLLQRPPHHPRPLHRAHLLHGAGSGLPRPDPAQLRRWIAR